MIHTAAEILCNVISALILGVAFALVFSMLFVSITGVVVWN